MCFPTGLSPVYLSTEADSATEIKEPNQTAAAFSSLTRDLSLGTKVACAACQQKG